MASTITNPLRQAEPYEEINVSHGGEEELEEYYIELERQELERRLSRSKSSRWSRKSVRGIDLRIQELAIAQESAQRRREARERAQQHTPPRADSRDRTPEPAPLPHWQERESAQRAAPATEYRKYELHNPSGPRWYINQHLLPPKTGARPLSIFSPNFPAFPSTPHIPPAPADAKTRRHAVTLDSKLPNDSDAQRSPNGDQWLKPPNGHVPGSPDERRTLGRNSTAPSSLSRMAPSPLSQSVSTLVTAEESGPATPQDFQPRITRKLSKREPGYRSFRGMFSSRQDSDRPPPASAPLPASPSASSLRPDDVNRPRPVSVMGASSDPRKRTSVLGKLTKKFSMGGRKEPPSMVVERPRNGIPPSPNGTARTFLGVTPAETAMSSRISLTAQQERRSVSPDKGRSRTISEVRRVPPPALDPREAEDSVRSLPPEPPSPPLPPPPDVSEHIRDESDGRSSPDTSFQIGHLMIANPDDHVTTTSQASTPRVQQLPLHIEPVPSIPPRFGQPTQDPPVNSISSIPFGTHARLQATNLPMSDAKGERPTFARRTSGQQPEAPLPAPPQLQQPFPQSNLSQQPRGGEPDARPNGTANGDLQRAPTTLVHAQYADPSQRAASKTPVNGDRGVVVDTSGEQWEVRPVRTRQNSTNGPSTALPSANGTTHARGAADHGNAAERVVERYRLQRMDSTGPAPMPPPKNPRRPALDRRASSDRENSPTKPSSRSSHQETTTQRLHVPTGPRPASDMAVSGGLSARDTWDEERLRKGASTYTPSDARDGRSREGSPEKASSVARRQASAETTQSLGSTHTAFVITPPLSAAQNPLPPPVSEVVYPASRQRSNGMPRPRATSERRAVQAQH